MTVTTHRLVIPSFLGVNGPREMVDWLMNNEGIIIADNYGRRWKYENRTFYFGDIGKPTKPTAMTRGCLHLCGTKLHVVQRKAQTPTKRSEQQTGETYD